MSDEKVVIEAARIGLPATATAAEIRDKVHAFPAEIAAITADRDKWRERAEENQANLVKARGAEAENKKLKGELMIQAARDLDKIDDGEVGFYRDLYASNPDLCQKRLEGLRERKYLRTQESLKGTVTDPPTDAVAEVEGRIAEKIAKDPTLTHGAAQRMIFDADPELYARYRQASAVRGGAA